MFSLTQDSNLVSYSPLDGVDENFTFVEAPGRAQGTPRRRPVSVIALNGEYVRFYLYQVI